MARRDEHGLQYLTFDQLHRVETLTSRGFAEVKYAGDVRVPQLRSRARLVAKALAYLGVAGVLRALMIFSATGEPRLTSSAR